MNIPKIQLGIVSTVLAAVIGASSAPAQSSAGTEQGELSTKGTDQGTFAGNDYNFQHLWTLILSRLGTNGLTDSETNIGSLPRLARTPIHSMNGPPDEADLIGLWNANRGILGVLKKDPQGREKLEALIDEEPQYTMKLLLASQAAPLGSAKGALFILNSIKYTDYLPAQNTFWAIGFMWYPYQTNPPDWLVGMTELALADDRLVTGLKHAGRTDSSSFTMSSLADEDAELTLHLGNSHCTNAAPILIDMVKKTDGRRGPVMALGELGDPRAIPVLIDLVKRKGPHVQNIQPLDDALLCPVYALADLHATEATPVLCEYLEHPDVIEALQELGDPAAVVSLQKLIGAGGRVDEPGASNNPEMLRARLADAKIVVATLDPHDRTMKLCQLLADRSFDQFQRRSVIWALADNPDPRAIPFLAKAIKTDPSGTVVDQAITAMAAFKYKAAVGALISCFDADFYGKSDWKRAYNPGMFRDNIADSLRTLTGQKIGANKNQWLQWWKKNHARIQGLK